MALPPAVIAFRICQRLAKKRRRKRAAHGRRIRAEKAQLSDDKLAQIYADLRAGGGAIVVAEMHGITVCRAKGIRAGRGNRIQRLLWERPWLITGGA